jgi:glycosyltransferase involved in cell wall biosynthesis
MNVNFLERKIVASLRVAMIAPPWLSIPPSGYGGVENVIAALVPELLKLGAKVELFTTGNSTLPATKTHWLYEEGQYDKIHKPWYDVLPIYNAHLMFALNTILDSGKFDVIHDHSGFLGPTLFSYAHPGLPPIIHTLHGPPFTTPDRLQLGIPDNLPMWKQFRPSNKLFFVGISKALTLNAPKSLQRLLLPCVHNAVDIAQFPFIKKKSDYFVTLARFHPEKGQHIAVRACIDLGHKLKMAGGVGEIMNARKVIMELANPLSKYRSLLDFRYFSDEIFPHLQDGIIEHLGEVTGPRKLDIIGRARALLFPIQWDEPFGMAAIEALACGTPVIAMARGALPEIIEHGVNGFLAKTEKEFRTYMARIDEIDPAECRKSVEERFSAHIMAKGYMERYRTAIQRAG